MSDFLQNAERGILSLMPTREVRYQRGVLWVTIHPTVAMTRIAMVDEDGVRRKAEMRDYLVDPEELILSDEQVEPEEGDLIIDTGDGATRTYTVMPGEAGEAWRYSERHYGYFRVHTKETVETAS